METNAADISTQLEKDLMTLSEMFALNEFYKAGNLKKLENLYENHPFISISSECEINSITATDLMERNIDHIVDNIHSISENITSLYKNIKNPEYYSKLNDRFSSQMESVLQNALNAIENTRSLLKNEDSHSTEEEQIHNFYTKQLLEGEEKIKQLSEESLLTKIINFSSTVIELSRDDNLKDIFNVDNPEFIQINETIPGILAELTWQQFSTSVNPNVEKEPNDSMSLDNYSRPRELQ